jgi:hypothetical protein
MADKINAIIEELNQKTYYPVLLQVIPKKGELIELYSFIDQSTAHQPNHSYEVVNVIHTIHDVTEKYTPSLNGSHGIKIIVKPVNEL